MEIQIIYVRLNNYYQIHIICEENLLSLQLHLQY